MKKVRSRWSKTSLNHRTQVEPKWVWRQTHAPHCIPSTLSATPPTTAAGPKQEQQKPRGQGRDGGEARVPLSSGTVCVPYFACRESLHQTWALGQPGCWAECGDVAGRRSKGGRGKPPSGILKTWHMHTVRQGIGCGCWGITITVIVS